jgi:hypothetical protein
VIQVIESRFQYRHIFFPERLFDQILKLLKCKQLRFEGIKVHRSQLLSSTDFFSDYDKCLLDWDGHCRSQLAYACVKIKLVLKSDPKRSRVRLLSSVLDNEV